MALQETAEEATSVAVGGGRYGGNNRERQAKTGERKGEMGDGGREGGTALIAPNMERGTGIMILLSLNRVHCLHATLKS